MSPVSITITLAFSFKTDNVKSVSLPTRASPRALPETRVTNLGGLTDDSETEVLHLLGHREELSLGFQHSVEIGKDLGTGV